MFDFLTMIVVFILGLGALITFHEFGHFFVARRLGVKTLCFSVGFGKKLVSFKAQDGTEYRIGMLPLGGYVKMLGEPGQALSVSEKEGAFSEKSVWARIAIVFAGPAFNFIFAFFAYMGVFLIGIQGIAPFVGTIEPGSIADNAGLSAPFEITEVAGVPTVTWQQVLNQIIPKIGDKGSLKLATRTSEGAASQSHKLNLENWEVDSKDPDLIGSLGIVPKRPPHPIIVNSLLPDSVAQTSGLLVGDEIIKIAGMPIENVGIFISELERRPNIETELTIVRQGNTEEPITLKIKPAAKQMADNRLSGHIGITLKPMPLPAGWIRTQKYSFLNSIKPAYEQTLYYTQVSFKLIGKLLVGKLSPAALSGPISIAQGAGTSFKMGFQYYLSFLALISISLGVINLLPIPLLDGGHLFFYMIEIFIRRPVPELVQRQASALGFILIIGLMGVSFYNDIMRLVVG